MKKIQLVSYLGLVPFVVLALTPERSHDFGKNLHLFLLYALMIISFMSGMMFERFRKNRQPYYGVYLSVGLAILAWGAFLMLSHYHVLYLYTAIFITLIIQDFMDHKMELVSISYFHMRFKVTIIVLLCHLLMVAKGIY